MNMIIIKLALITTHKTLTILVTCGENNGYCDQLCLGLYNESYVCACGTGFQLDRDLRSCTTGNSSKKKNTK